MIFEIACVSLLNPGEVGSFFVVDAMPSLVGTGLPGLLPFALVVVDSEWRY